MTKIIFYKNSEKKIYRFDITGHTDFGFSGSDVLCAALSALVSHTIGAIQEFTDESCNNIVDESIPSVSFILTQDDPGEGSQLFLEALASSADDLAFKYPENIIVEYNIMG